MMELAGPLLISLGLLLLNGFFVLAEYAIIKVRASRVEELARKGSHTAALVRQITKRLDAYLSAIQLGMTMSSLGIGWIGEPAAARLLAPAARALPWVSGPRAAYTVSFGAAFAMITFLHVVVGELVPKRMAIRNPTRSALIAAAPLSVVYRLFYVPMAILTWSSNALLRVLSRRGSEESELEHSEEELKILLAYSQERGAIPLTRLLLFENLFDFGGTMVRDVMTPGAAAACLSLERSWEENLAVIRARRHTRYPLVGKDLGDLKGFVHLKDLVLAEASGAPNLAALRREPAFVGEGAALERALAELRQKRAHMAFVRNKTGQVTGLITLEDILEELVGEIHDEFESAPTGSLSEVVVDEAIEMGLAAKDKSEALRWMLKRLTAARPEVDFREAWDLIWKRETALTSAVGGGVALPHGRLPSLSRPMVALARAPEGIDFDAIDKKPVKLIFMILTPLREPGAQLRLLAKVATLASHDTFRRNLMRAKTAREAHDILQAFDQSMTE